MRPAHRHTALTLCALISLAGLSDGVQPAPAPSRFAAEIERLSEPGGFFDTDNLISNERDYLHVIPALVAGGVSGGTYIGVGPDQNFSYITRIRPRVAYIIDIRRDNLLLHLLFKALFARSATRVEYLSQLTGRAPPGDWQRWRGATIDELVAYVDQRRPDASRVQAFRRALDSAVTTFGLQLAPDDLETIDRFHRTFIASGLDLRFQTFGRSPRPNYPTLRELLLATDAAGQVWNYLAREDDFQFLKAMQARDAIVPLVGNVAGLHAMAALARTIAARGDRVSAFYISNIETYLRRTGDAARFDENLRRLPHDSRSVVIRAVFGAAGSSRSLVEPIDSQPPETQQPR